MAFSQGLIQLLNIGANQGGWDAVVDSNKDKVQQQYKTFRMSGDGAGEASGPTPERVTIQLADGEDTDVNKESYLRVRISDSGAWGTATNATIAVAGSTTVVTTHTANKDLTIKSDSQGEFLIDVTDSVAETIDLVLGPPELREDWAHYDQGLSIVIAP